MKKSITNSGDFEPVAGKSRRPHRILSYSKKIRKVSTPTLADLGDCTEVESYWRFIKNRWPSYEHYWTANILRLRKKNSIHIVDDSNLPKGEDSEMVQIAQLLRVTLSHMNSVYDLIGTSMNRKDVFYSFVHLSAAIDLASELFGRLDDRKVHRGPSKYSAWQTHWPPRSGPRYEWFDKDKYSDIQKIRDYRNFVVHSMDIPGLNVGVLFVPMVGKETRFIDWRKVTNESKDGPHRKDLDKAEEVVSQSWGKVLHFLEENLSRHVLPHP